MDVSCPCDIKILREGNEVFLLNLFRIYKADGSVDRIMKDKQNLPKTYLQSLT
ncbi:hypothetical protein HMPREF1554_01863 [Porphyromonas gingivalis F0569]|nr:hypothetical protein HMPREF1554_01863 [Porphyromonas gingivalis F0569]OWR80264.1 hypothetical protein SJDPG11_03800 [Porphyromonas gingivalis SJD11]